MARKKSAVMNESPTAAAASKPVNKTAEKKTLLRLQRQALKDAKADLRAAKADERAQLKLHKETMRPILATQKHCEREIAKLEKAIAKTTV